MRAIELRLAAVGLKNNGMARKGTAWLLGLRRTSQVDTSSSYSYWQHVTLPVTPRPTSQIPSPGVGGVTQSRRARAIIVAITLLASSTGCTSWHIQQGAVTDVVPTNGSIRVWLPDESRLTLDDARVAGDTLYGRVVEHLNASEPLSVGSTATVMVDQLFETFQTREFADWPIYLALGGVAFIAALVYLSTAFDDLGCLFCEN